jgi:hypothetical protein
VFENIVQKKLAVKVVRPPARGLALTLDASRAINRR